MRIIPSVLLLTTICTAGSSLFAATVPLQNPTASYSQPFGDFRVSLAIDEFPDTTGWAVQQAHGYGIPATAAFETVQNLGFPAGTEITFRIKTRYPLPDGNANLGRFRLSATTDHRDSFADGLVTNGDVDANWAVLQPERWSSVGGAQMTKQPDGSLLVSGPNVETETLIVVAQTTASGITGFRLEVMSDPSLPNGGPGRASNGNFVMIDFSVSAEPVRTQSTIRVSAVDICWESVGGRTYQVQYATEVTPNQWQPLGNPVQAVAGTNCVTDTVRGLERRFYRVIDAP